MRICGGHSGYKNIRLNFYDGHWKIYRPYADRKNKWVPNNVPITAMDEWVNTERIIENTIQNGVKETHSGCDLLINDKVEDTIQNGVKYTRLVKNKNQTFVEDTIQNGVKHTHWVTQHQELEVEDALEGKSVADMSRAKQVKSLFRMVTPHLSLKDIPMIVVNHTYKEIGMFPKDIVGGGTGSYYSADNIFIIGRQQEKEGTEVVGYNFIINVEKSRYVKEKSKIPVTVSFDGGISKWSGLLDIALESGHVIKPSNGWYSKVDVSSGEVEDKKYREKDTHSKEFWLSVLKQKSFQEFVENKYRVAAGEIMQSDAFETEDS